MRSDALLAFVPIGAPLSLVGGAGIDIRAPQIIDLLGEGVGMPPTNIIGNVATFGTDPGIGGMRPELNVSIGTALVSADGGLLNLQLQAAADPGAAGNYTPAPADWVTIVETGPMALANLVAGAIPFRIPWLPVFPPNLRPRFLSLNADVGAGSFMAGTIASALVTFVRDDQANKFAAKNFTVR